MKSLFFSRLASSTPLRALLLAASVTGAVGCAADTTDEAVDTDTQALINAPLDTQNPWSVGVCSSTPNQDPAKGPIGACLTPGTRCTGSLIAPNLVLTARHCVEKFDADIPTPCKQNFAGPMNDQGVRVTFSSSLLNANPGWVEVKKVLTSNAVAACENDVALLVLDRTVSPNQGTPIALELGSLVANPALRPEKVALVGRGVLKFVLDPATLAPKAVDLGNLERRWLDGIPFRCISDVAGKCKTRDITAGDELYTYASVGQFIFGRGAGSGDSGSAVLTQKSFSQKHPVAIGVYSIGTFGPNGYGNAGIAARLDTHASWIKAGVKEAAKAGNYAVPCWASDSPNCVALPPPCHANDATDDVKSRCL